MSNKDRKSRIALVPEWFTLLLSKRETTLKRLTTLIFPTLYIVSILGLTPAFADEPHVKVRLVPEHTHIAASETIQIAVEQTIDPHWHTYWVNPGDSGTAPEISWKMPDGFTTGDFAWPVPQKIPFGPLTNYGYEDKVVLLQALTAPAKLPDGPLTLDAEVTILVCADICIPETSTHTVILNDGENIDNSGLIANAQKHFPEPVSWQATFHEDGQIFVIDIPLNDHEFFSSTQSRTPVILPHEWGIIDNVADAETLQTTERLRLTQKRGNRALSEIRELRTVLTYTDKNGGYRSVEIVALPAAQKSAAASSTAGEMPPPAQQTTLFAALLFALLGGIILNLMPCVFPVLSLKVISLSKMSDKEQSHAATSGFTYTAGVILSFALIAGTLMALKAAGAEIGWGFQLQNAAVVYGLALLLFIIGLNLSGVFMLQGSFTSVGQKLTQQNGLTGTFFTGVLATLVATPCTAPFMGAAMGYALTQPAVSGMSVFIALGLGLALPYLLLTLLPPLRKLLPRPGVWMETFKEFLAFPMYASAAWLIWVYAQQAGGMAVLSALLGFVAVAFTLWAWKRRPAGKAARLIVNILILTVLACGLALSFTEALRPVEKTALTATGDEMWENFTTTRLEELLRGNDPVFIDMTAAWCITCKVNERVALNIPETRMLFDEKNITALKGDWTNQNPEITKFLESHGRKGVPIYVFYASRDPVTGERPAPEILPQLLTPAIVAEAIK